jgi:hypothetical protein
VLLNGSSKPLHERQCPAVTAPLQMTAFRLQREAVAIIEVDYLPYWDDDTELQVNANCRKFRHLLSQCSCNCMRLFKMSDSVLQTFQLETLEY